MSEFKKEIIVLFEMMLTNQQKIISLLEGRLEPDMNDPANWLTPEETLQILPVSIRTLYNLRKTEELIWKKIGRLYLYFKPSIFRIRGRYIK